MVNHAECGKGWTGRCAAAKSPTCKCRCGGENHGNPKARGGLRRDEFDFTPEEDLFYGCNDARDKRFTERGHRIVAVRFTRIAGEPSPFGGEQRGEPIIEVVYSDHKERLEQSYRKHSQGMEFGYGGSGPADAALNILASFIPVKEATVHGMYHAFKFAFVARISQEEGGEVSGAAIRDWIADHWSMELLKNRELAMAEEA